MIKTPDRSLLLFLQGHPKLIEDHVSSCTTGVRTLVQRRRSFLPRKFHISAQDAHDDFTNKRRDSLSMMFANASEVTLGIVIFVRARSNENERRGEDGCKKYDFVIKSTAE